eukprot:scaffold64111_cov69-Phaeocystis_antarctica.AAC.7
MDGTKLRHGDPFMPLSTRGQTSGQTCTRTADLHPRHPVTMTKMTAHGHTRIATSDHGWLVPDGRTTNLSVPLSKTRSGGAPWGGGGSAARRVISAASPAAPVWHVLMPSSSRAYACARTIASSRTLSGRPPVRAIASHSATQS